MKIKSRKMHALRLVARHQAGIKPAKSIFCKSSEKHSHNKYFIEHLTKFNHKSLFLLAKYAKFLKLFVPLQCH